MREQISREKELAEQRAAERRRIMARENVKGSKGTRSGSWNSDDKNKEWPPTGEYENKRKGAREKSESSRKLTIKLRQIGSQLMEQEARLRKKKGEAVKIKTPDYNTGRTWREMAKPLETLYSRLE